MTKTLRYWPLAKFGRIWQGQICLLYVLSVLWNCGWTCDDDETFVIQSKLSKQATQAPWPLTFSLRKYLHFFHQRNDHWPPYNHHLTRNPQFQNCIWLEVRTISKSAKNVSFEFHDHRIVLFHPQDIASYIFTKQLRNRFGDCPKLSLVIRKGDI